MTATTHDTGAIRAALALLTDPGQVVELRVPNVGGRGNNTASGYYTDPDLLAQAAARFNGRAAVYVTLHEVNPDLLARAANRVQEYAKATTTDADIISRRYLPVDCDPARPAGISASDAEHDAALERARTIRGALRSEGWPEPIYADSGNGGHLLYHVALPADDGGLSQRALKGLSARFSDAAVKVDESVYNPARIWKVYGTFACKGDSTADRPHRLACIIDAPDEIATVPLHLLEQLADAAQETPGAPAGATRAGAMPFGVDAYLAGHGVAFTGPVPYKGGLKWMLDACVWNGHTDHAAVVWQEPGGKVCANCSHNSCEGKGWTDLRAALEGPRWREALAAKQREFEGRQRAWQERGQQREAAPESGIAAVWTPSANTWPEPLADEAYYGLPGEIVRAIEPHTESDPAALLLQLLVGTGNLIGRSPTLMMDGAAHHTNLFTVLVGTTSKARKGTSWRQIRRVLALTDPEWAEKRITGGLSSGEGLIEAVADPPPSDEPPPEPADKRLMIQVGEFASVLAVQGREGNTLSAVLRDAWDGETLTVLNRKANKLRATAPHISMVAHVTRDELLRMLQTTEAANGYANRFLWAAVRRPKLLPRGGNLTDATLTPLAERLRGAVVSARKTQHVTLTAGAWELWDTVYAELSKEQAGLLGAITARAEPLVLRLAMLYALMDGASKIDVPHLMAGSAVWEYCERSAAWIFGDQLGDPDGDLLLSHLRQRPEGITRTEIHGIFGRNRSATQVNRALTSLEEKNLARRVEETPDDRRLRTERWYAVSPEGK